jgi:hypothetical protein
MQTNVVVPVGMCPSTVDKTSIRILVCTTGRLYHAVQSDELSNDKFSHGFSFHGKQVTQPLNLK